MSNVLRRMVVVMFCLGLVGLQPQPVRGADAASGKQKTTQAAPAQQPVQQKPAGCPHMMEGGSCCADCQGNAAQAQTGGAAAPMDCPCQHAKQAGKES